MTRSPRLELAWSEYQGRECIRIRGWSTVELRRLGGLAHAELSRRLVLLPSALSLDAEIPRALPSVAGRFVVDDDAVWFIPRFPFLDGAGYALLVDPAPEGQDCHPAIWTLERPARMAAPATDVVAIYPSTAELPVNQLKLYVHFSAPMSEGWANRAVSVHRADTDEPLSDVFLAMEPELWDRGRRRLTLLLDPGRIKRGLVPNTEAGYPLIEGVPIVVRVDTGFRDANGRPLWTGAERRYGVGAPVRAHVDPARWRVHVPVAGSGDPLTVVFDRPLDRALLEHSLWVHDAAGAPLAGRGLIGAEERSWRFEPCTAWSEGRHAVAVDPHLEDLAGNSLVRVFDRDLLRPEDAPVDPQYAMIAFSPAPRTRNA